MKWYLILIPFISIFLYTGYKWQVYNQQISSMDNIAINSLYSSTNIAKIRNYDAEMEVEQFVLDYIRYFVFESGDDYDSNINIKIQNTNPPAITISITNYLGNVTPTTTKTYVLDSTE